MPDMTGYEIASRIRARGRARADPAAQTGIRKCAIFYSVQVFPGLCSERAYSPSRNGTKGVGDAMETKGYAPIRVVDS